MLTFVIKPDSVHRRKLDSSQINTADWTEEIKNINIKYKKNKTHQDKIISHGVLFTETSVQSSNQYISARRNLIAQRNVFHIMQ